MKTNKFIEHYNNAFIIDKSRKEFIDKEFERILDKCNFMEVDKEKIETDCHYIAIYLLEKKGWIFGKNRLNNQGVLFIKENMIVYRRFGMHKRSQVNFIKGFPDLTYLFPKEFKDVLIKIQQIIIGYKAYIQNNFQVKDTHIKKVLDYSFPKAPGIEEQIRTSLKKGILELPVNNIKIIYTNGPKEKFKMQFYYLKDDPRDQIRPGNFFFINDKLFSKVKTAIKRLEKLHTQQTRIHNKMMKKIYDALHSAGYYKLLAARQLCKRNNNR